MATRGLTANVIWIIQVIEIIRTILPLRKCYGFENRGRVGIVNRTLRYRINKEILSFQISK